MLEVDKGKKVTKPDFPKKFPNRQKSRKCGQNGGFWQYRGSIKCIPLVLIIVVVSIQQQKDVLFESRCSGGGAVGLIEHFLIFDFYSLLNL